MFVTIILTLPQIPVWKWNLPNPRRDSPDGSGILQTLAGIHRMEVEFATPSQGFTGWKWNSPHPRRDSPLESGILHTLAGIHRMEVEFAKPSKGNLFRARDAIARQ